MVHRCSYFSLCKGGGEQGSREVGGGGGGGLAAQGHPVLAGPRSGARRRPVLPRVPRVCGGAVQRGLGGGEWLLRPSSAQRLRCPADEFPGGLGVLRRLRSPSAAFPAPSSDPGATPSGPPPRSRGGWPRATVDWVGAGEGDAGSGFPLQEATAALHRTSFGEDVRKKQTDLPKRVQERTEKKKRRAHCGHLLKSYAPTARNCNQYSAVVIKAVYLTQKDP